MLVAQYPGTRSVCISHFGQCTPTLQFHFHHCNLELEVPLSSNEPLSSLSLAAAPTLHLSLGGPASCVRPRVNVCHLSGWNTTRMEHAGHLKNTLPPQWPTYPLWPLISLPLNHSLSQKPHPYHGKKRILNSRATCPYRTERNHKYLEKSAQMSMKNQYLPSALPLPFAYAFFCIFFFNSPSSVRILCHPDWAGRGGATGHLEALPEARA